MMIFLVESENRERARTRPRRCAREARAAPLWAYYVEKTLKNLYWQRRARRAHDRRLLMGGKAILSSRASISVEAGYGMNDGKMCRRRCEPCASKRNPCL